MVASDIEKELAALKAENAKLRNKIETLENGNNSSSQEKYPLTLEEYRRYGRQMIVKEFNGLDGQMKLKNAKVLVIGAGGLGCPALLYLVAAGIGHFGIVDNDTVDESNLHRQVLHDTSKVGMLKCESAKQKLFDLNPLVNIKTYPVRLNNDNAFDIFKDYDLIMDCTDTPLTRYLVSDVAVILGKTVVSASGLGSEGQLSILNYENQGPCYRCFYPNPPNPYVVNSCQEGGVIGPCIGIVGMFMAVEVIKILVGVYTPENFEPSLMLYSGFPTQSLRTFKMRGKQDTCVCCSSNPTVTKETIESGKINYQVFCGIRNYNVCKPEERMNVSTFHNDYISNINTNTKTNDQVILLDVRPNHHFNISHFDNAINIPVVDLKKMKGSMDLLQKKIPGINQDSEVVVLCRYGNDSQLATRLLKDDFSMKNIKDVQGGFFKYIDEMDPSIPKY